MIEKVRPKLFSRQPTKAAWAPLSFRVPVQLTQLSKMIAIFFIEKKKKGNADLFFPAQNVYLVRAMFSREPMKPFSPKIKNWASSGLTTLFAFAFGALGWSLPKGRPVASSSLEI